MYIARSFKSRSLFGFNSKRPFLSGSDRPRLQAPPTKLFMSRVKHLFLLLYCFILTMPSGRNLNKVWRCYHRSQDASGLYVGKCLGCNTEVSVPYFWLFLLCFPTGERLGVQAEASCCSLQQAEVAGYLETSQAMPHPIPSRRFPRSVQHPSGPFHLLHQLPLHNSGVTAVLDLAAPPEAGCGQAAKPPSIGGLLSARRVQAACSRRAQEAAEQVADPVLGWLELCAE